MNQTLAILLDSYRDLNSKRLFWFSLVISGLIVAAFALVTIHEDGLRIIAWDVNIPGLNSREMAPSLFYKSLFVALGLGIWLTWVAAILALISTAGIFPDLVSSGSIDLVVSKPISRMRIFFTKFAGGLLFVTLQVTVFSLACFLVIGWKGGDWVPAVLLAIPIVVVFFSYLFCMCALFGVWTRSTVASLLLTLLVWFVIFIVHAGESSLLAFTLVMEQETEHRTTMLESLNHQRAQLEEQTGAEAEASLARVDEQIASQRVKLTNAETTRETVDLIHNIVFAIKTVLPKTAETTSLTERWLIDMAELEEAKASADQNSSSDFNVDQRELEMDLAGEVRSRSVWWVIGTSLAFEAVVLSLACWLFARRDY